MPGVETGVIYTAAELRSFAVALFERVGLSPEDAAVVADSLVEANLRGVDTHGVTRMLTVYVKRMHAGLMEVNTRINVERERPSGAMLDGCNSVGQVVAKRAMDIAIAKAAQTGSGFVSVKNTNHFGACAYWAMMALPHDQIGIAMTNGPAFVPPTGGKEALLSTNPFAYAIPGGVEGPVVVDMATTTVARGRIVLYAKQNLPLPDGWALDRDGRPTNDAQEALKGFLQPMAGHKGYGLSLVIDILSGVLSGGLWGKHVGGPLADDFSRPTGVSSFFGAIAVDSFIDVPEFKDRMDQLLREIRNGPRAAGVDRIYVPGDIEAEMTQRRLQEGIPIPEVIVQEFVDLGNELGIPFPQKSAL